MEFVEQLKASVDIVGVVQTYVRLRKAGPRYVALCPFHVEKSPSFSVHPGHQFFKCFGCGEGGDVIGFVMKIQNLSFPEALKLLADSHGIAMPKRSEYSDPETKLRAALYEMHEIAAAHFRAQLAGSSGAETREYVAKRGVHAESVEKFELGYADRGGRTLVQLFQKRNLSPDQMEESGLVGKREDGSLYDRFRHRLMFPIHDESGKVIAFGGRALDPAEKAKYLNSPETKIYKKSYVLYNLHRAKEAIRKNDRAVLVEGYMDVIGVYAAGVQEVVASCGTSLTPHQVRGMKRHSRNIAVNFDPDSAGAKAAERSIQILLDESMHIRVVQLEGGLDPDEYCKENGADAYRRQVQDAKSYFYWLADRARGKYDMRTSEGRVAAFQFLLPAIQGLSDKLERMSVANDVASYLGVDTGLVLENFRKMAADRREKVMQPVKEGVRPADRLLLNVLVSRREARDELIPELKMLPAMEQPPFGRIYGSLFAMHDSGAPVNFAELHARLEENDRELLASTLLREDSGDTKPGDEDTLHIARACVDRLRMIGRDAESALLKARVKEAERSGNFTEALRLMGELKEMERV